MAQPHAAMTSGTMPNAERATALHRVQYLSAAVFSTCPTFDTTDLVSVTLFAFALLRGLEHDVTRTVAHNACASIMIITARFTSRGVKDAGSFRLTQERVLTRHEKRSELDISNHYRCFARRLGVYVSWNGCTSTRCLVSNTGPVQTPSIHSTIPTLSKIIRRPSRAHIYIVAL